jgi:hypothetical protein
VEVTRNCKKNFYEEEPPSPNIRIMESMWGRWVGYVAYMGDVRMYAKL